MNELTILPVFFFVNVGLLHLFGYIPLVLLNIILMFTAAAVSAFLPHNNKKVTNSFPFFPLMYPFIIYWLITDFKGKHNA